MDACRRLMFCPWRVQEMRYQFMLCRVYEHVVYIRPSQIWSVLAMGRFNPLTLHLSPTDQGKSKKREENV